MSDSESTSCNEFVTRGRCNSPGCTCLQGKHIVNEETDHIAVCSECTHSWREHANLPAAPSPATAAPFTPLRSTTQLLTVAALPTGGSPPSNVFGTCSMRKKTVENLLAQIRSSHVVLVQGHPAVGKTTLLSLLYHHIDSLPADAHLNLYRFFAWPKDFVQQAGGWQQYIYNATRGELNLRDLRSPRLPYLLLLDEAQCSYWDNSFWAEYIKVIAQESVGTNVGIHHIVLFASYGSSMTGNAPLDHEATPPFLTAKQTVTLLPQPSLPWQVGILLTKDEFMETYELQTKAPPLVPSSGGLGDRNKWVAGPEVAEYLFQVTQGHAGGFKGLLHAFQQYKVIRDRIRKGLTITIDFLESIFFAPPLLKDSGIGKLADTFFKRSLPDREDMHSIHIATVLQRIIRDQRLLSQDAALLAENDQIALRKCLKRGWIHLHQDKNLLEPNAYVMASRLHQWYVSRLLISEQPPHSLAHLPAGFPTTSRELLVQAVRRFRPSQFRQRNAQPQRGAAGALRTREASFHDEFYRSVHALLRGNIYTVPEYGTGGRCDFFVPDMGWGVELLTYEQRLDEHVRRFLPAGGYAGMKLADWVVANCTTTDVAVATRYNWQTKYGSRVLHVVFTEDWNQVKIRDANGVELLAPTRLLEA